MSAGPRRAWWELLRAANVFTAASNVAAGHLLVHHVWRPWSQLALLVAASCLLYAAGMVLNDAFDAEVDARERPERPIPSGRITRPVAFRVGWSLLAFGVVGAAFAAWHAQRVGPLVVALCLALAIVLYDSGLKNSWAGPFAMGWCRSLNVLLGASAAADLGAQTGAWIVASAVGLYTIGITWLARSEVTVGKAHSLRLGGLASMTAVALVAAWGRVAAPRYNETVWFIGLASMLLIVGGSPLWTFWVHPTAALARRQVGRLIIGFLLIDAWVAALSAGWPAGVAIAALVIPTRLVAHRAPMT